MRIVLKPAGAGAVILALIALAVIAFGKISHRTPALASDGIVPEQLGGTPMIVPTAERWTLSIQKPADAQMTMFTDQTLAAKDNHALHLVVKSVDPVKYWAAQLIKRVPNAVPAHHSMVVRFWGRSKTSTPAYIVFEEGQSPHASELSQVVRFTPDWKLYECPFVTSKDHTDIHANFCVKAGISPGEIDLSTMEVNDLGEAK